MEVAMGKEGSKERSLECSNKKQKLITIQCTPTLTTCPDSPLLDLELQRRPRGLSEAWVACIPKAQRWIILGTATGHPLEGLPKISRREAREAAQRWYRRFFGEMVPNIPTDPTVSDTLKAYLQHVAEDRPKLSLGLQQRAAEIEWEWGICSLADLSHDGLRIWLAELVWGPRPGADPSPWGLPPPLEAPTHLPCPHRLVTATRLLKLLKSALHLALLRGWVDSDEAWRNLRQYRPSPHPGGQSARRQVERFVGVYPPPPSNRYLHRVFKGRNPA